MIMKKVFLCAVLLLVFSLSAKDLKVLMIGNSFSICVGKYLPQMVASAKGGSLELTSAYIGGCSLERHWNNIIAAEKDLKLKQYRVTVWNSDGRKPADRYMTVLELLKTCKYDIVTIQQNSANSYKYHTFQPYAKNLIGVIKKFQPQAEIVIQQTWSYRADAGHFAKGMTNDEMYEGLAEAYGRLAKENGFRIIPTGYAVQLSRKHSPEKFKGYDKAILKTLSWPDLPPQAGDVVGKAHWAKGQNGKMRLVLDATHLNVRGEYMQAALWFTMLFDRDCTEISFVPDDIGDDDAEFLKMCAQEAADTFRK